MTVVYLDDADETDVKRNSSIDQHREFLSVKKGMNAIPIRFDKLDWVNCDGIKSHPIIISYGTDYGYNYQVRHYTYFTDKYLMMDRNEVVVKQLPHWYGEGWYEQHIGKKTFTNFDDSSLGVRNRIDLRIGTDFVSAEEILEDSDES